MKRVITYGTFDMFHIGHLNLLKRAKAEGDYLIVAVSSDEFNLVKGKKSIISFDERKAIVESIKYVDEVIKEDDWNQKQIDIKKYNIDTFVMGDDWRYKFDFLKEFCNVIYLDRTKNISTTKLKKSMETMVEYLHLMIKELQ